MKTLATLLAGSAAGILLAAGAAQAGACSGEIMALQKQMEETPTMASGAAGSTATGTAPLPTDVPQNAGQTLGAPPSDAAGGSQSAVAPPSAEPLPDASGGTLVQNDAPAPTEPMDADAADAAQLNTAAGADAAAQDLARARALDQAGDEAGCMTAIEAAKGHLAQ